MPYEKMVSFRCEAHVNLIPTITSATTKVISKGHNGLTLWRTDENPDGSAKCEVREGHLGNGNTWQNYNHSSLYDVHGDITQLKVYWGMWEVYGLEVK